MGMVCIHELSDPEVYRRGRGELIALFKQWTGIPSETRHFSVSPAGMVYYADHGELWRDSEIPRALPETPEQA
ncbi:hypothetical protein V6O07_17990, partial [Arthrospira platensis SPKY2]